MRYRVQHGDIGVTYNTAAEAFRSAWDLAGEAPIGDMFVVRDRERLMPIAIVFGRKAPPPPG